jgi:hypothetical protein
MPHQSLKILAGVDQNKTPALNEAAISQSQLIRFIPDRTLGGLVQKLGGWTKYVVNSMGSIVRSLWAWEDTNANSYLAVGAEGIAAGGGGALQIVQSGSTTDITPRRETVNVTVDFSTTSGSNEITVTDTGRKATNYDVVNIQTQVAVGGLVLFGQYQVYNPTNATNSYKIYAANVLGEPAYATSTVTNGGAIASFATTNGSDFVSVTLANHGYVAGDTFPVLVATSVGGTTIYGNYTVLSITSSSVFVISASNTASSTTTGSENGGQVRFLYERGIGPLAAGTGWGIGPYGGGGWGTGISATFTGTPINAVDWTLDNWGSYLIANPLNGPIYIWDPSSGNSSAIDIATAPPVNEGMFVAMPQRQVIAWGSTFTGIVDPLLIRWSDVNSFDVWIDTPTNQAGSYRIPKGSKIIQCIQGPQQALIWTDLAVWAMQYAGLPYVYQFNEISTGCGLIGRKAAGTMNGVVYWMSQSQFYKMDGGGITPIRCPVWDVVFQDLDTTNLDKIRIAPNSRFGEITWYFPTTSNGGENEGYVKYNIILDQWDYGFNSDANPYVARSAWINQSVLGPPIGAGYNYFLYQHETSTDADGQPMNSYFQTGYFTLQEADVLTFIDQVWPDMKWGYYGGTQGANILLTFYVTQYPTEAPTAYGPYTLTDATHYITPRFRGRLVSIKIESNDIGSFWRLGNIRYRLAPDGRF